MKERPILFSGPMVRAILEGRKTLTRRVVKPQPDFMHGENPYWLNGGYRLSETAFMPLRCPYGQPGDRLWVRETFADVVMSDDSGKTYPYAYRADGSIIGCHRWKPSIHMPRRASRILLEITAVHVERLQDISEEDSELEGVRSLAGCREFWMDYLKSDKHTEDFTAGSAKYSFQTLWESINGPESWEANSWVWVIEFKRVTQ